LGRRRPLCARGEAGRGPWAPSLLRLVPLVTMQPPPDLLLSQFPCCRGDSTRRFYSSAAPPHTSVHDAPPRLRRTSGAARNANITMSLIIACAIECSTEVNDRRNTRGVPTRYGMRDNLQTPLDMQMLSCGHAGLNLALKKSNVATKRHCMLEFHTLHAVVTDPALPMFSLVSSIPHHEYAPRRRIWFAAIGLSRPSPGVALVSGPWSHVLVQGANLDPLVQLRLLLAPLYCKSSAWMPLRSHMLLKMPPWRYRFAGVSNSAIKP